MTRDLAKSTVIEMTEHVRGRLDRLPGVTDIAIQNLVFSWVREEQPAVLGVLSADEIVKVIADRGAGTQSSGVLRESLP